MEILATTMPREPAEITALRRALGERLAVFRQAAGLTQGQLAKVVFCDRTSVAHIEHGRRSADERFWGTVDDACGANGALLAAFVELEAATHAHEQEMRAVKLAEARVRITAWQHQEQAPTAASTGSVNKADGDVGWAADGDAARTAAVTLWSANHPDMSPLDDRALATSQTMVLKWLLARPDAAVAANGARSVSRDDVTAVLAMKRSLRALDHEHGGGAVLPLALTYLRSEVSALLRGRYSEPIASALFAAAAEMALVAGWMAYDAAQHGHARKQMLHALRFSQVAGDRLFGGRVLTAMSHQALHIGQIRESTDFAAAARTGAGAAPPAAVALFAATEARALAVSGDKQACFSLMGTAQRALDKASAADGPEWLVFMDHAELAGKFGRCLRDLGLHREAGSQLGTSLSLQETQYPRSRAITKIIWATNYARQGELEPACQLGLEALPDIGQLRSQRTRDYLIDLYRDLDKYQREPLVQSFREQARHLALDSPHGEALI